MILDITSKRLGNDVAILEMSGRIMRGPESEQIEELVADLMREKQSKVIFDLARVKHIDSTGVGILVMCSGKLNDAGGELRLAGATGMVERTLRLTRLNCIVPTFASLAEATAGLTSTAKAPAV